ncbi:MAG: DUF58 domain-containing protein [Nitrososphaerota archaeon]|nr:DUF58 domain-containing protein [Candidatus Bathyarchaeota archaeon]MDW8022228.1 DUF58 domain-containing protein [Nitrososphaerota archaeon]
MLSQRVPLLITFSAILVLVSIALKDWRPSILILPITSLLILVNTLSPKSGLNIEVKRKLAQESVITGETVTVKLEIANRGKERVDYLEIYDTLPAGLRLTEGTNRLIVSLEAGERIEFSYEILCSKRGVYKIGPAYLRTRDPLGFNFVEKMEPATAVLRVLPKIEKLKASDLPFKQTAQWPGVIHSSQKGTGTEFYGLRDYLPGDDLRRIEWKASARMGKLITIENESERSTDIVIILDASSDLVLGNSSDSLLEYCVRAAGSLASLLLSLGNQVSVINHCASRSWLPGGFGKRHLRSVLDHLTSVEAGESPLPIGFGLERIFKSKPQVILVSPLIAPNVIDDVKNIISEGYNVLVVSPFFPWILAEESDEAARIALRILALERRNVIAELRRYCTVVDWNPEVPLKTAMRGIRRRI